MSSTTIGTRAARSAAAVLDHRDLAREASLSGAADGAVIGLAVGAVFGIATTWPVSLAALTGGLLVGTAWGAALGYLHHASQRRATDAEPTRR